MAEKNRNYSVFLLVLALVGAALFYGCGSSSSDSFPAIEYSITGSYTSEGLSSVNTSARAVSGLASGILIYSESDPSNYADVDTAARTFVIRNLKPGKHYIVFKHMPNGSGATTYICRSSKPVTLTEANPVQACEKLSAEECTISIRGKVSDLTGKIITPTPILTLWGQNVEVDALTGYFTTPKMPVHTVADLIINAVNYQQTSSPLSFEDNPAYFEITAVDTGSNNVPPTINLSSKKAIYNTNSNVTFKAEAQDANKDDLEFIWNIESCTAANPGTLEKGGDTQKGASFTSEYYWDAPEDDCMATISVMVREKNTVQKLSATAKLQIQIGTGYYKPNTKPIITSTTIYPSALYGKRNYTITCNATDTDGDALTQNLTITPSVKDSVLIRKSGSGNAWLWSTPDLDSEKTFTLSFEVRDPKGNIASLSKDVKVLPTTPNTPPVIVSVSPTETTTVMSGKDLNLVVNAADNENDKLSFKWDFKRGDQITNSFYENTASLTWRAPILNSDTPTSIYCVVSDSFGETATATFNVIITPDPNKKAPVIDITINGTGSEYSGMKLFKPNEIVSFVGKATDSNQNVAIDPSHYVWMLMGPEDSDFKLIAQGTSNATYTVLTTSNRGNFTVKMTATDIGGSIKGEETKDFRINALPLVSMLVNGNSIGTDGRMKNASGENVATYIYLDKYDVFQYETEGSISLVASCSDIETNSTNLENAANWLHGTNLSLGANYNAPLNIAGLNTIQLSTTDSKGESSATSTYQYFVNSAPVFETATSSKVGYINSDEISVSISVRDDNPGLSMGIYISTRSSGGPWSDYSLLTLPSGSNPVTSTSNTLTSNPKVNATTLMAAFPDKNDFRIKLIATDSMGLQTVNDNIGFSIVTSHKLKNFTVASGTYNPNKKPYTFDELATPEGTFSAPYDFEASQIFSIRSGSDLWEDAMTWTWYDSLWVNNAPGPFKTITGDVVDGYTLNGYQIKEEFGTHTIRLEGRSNEYGIVASKSIDIFINSTPQIAFNNASGGTMRFDTGSNATFSITLKEDNKNEKLGLLWTVYDLDKNCNEIVSQALNSPRIYSSHDLDNSTSDVSSMDMASSNEKGALVNWNKISPDELLASGAKRVYVQVYDAYGKAATASIDILVNTLPEFRPVVNNRLVKIIVPTNPDDSEENYEYFVEQYATTTTNIPVFLVSGNPSMQLEFTADSSDFEYPTFFDEHPENIVWKYTNEKGQEMTPTGKTIRGRFAIGENVINVDCRDFFYNYYSKDGKAVYNDMCVSSASESFYLWQSMAFDMPNVSGNFIANALYQVGNTNDFYMTYGNNLASFAAYLEINTGIQTLVTPVDFGIDGVSAEIERFKPAEGDGYESYPVKQTVKLGNIITLIPRGSNDYYMLTDSLYRNISDEAVKYYDSLTDKEVGYSGIVASYTAIKLNNTESIFNWHPVKSFGMEGDLFPGSDKDFPKRIISMTYCSSTDDSAGAMLLHNWKGTTDVLAAYYNNRLRFIDLVNSNPLYSLDGIPLSFTENSKVRFLPELKISQNLFITDTNNNRLVRCSSAFSDATSIAASYPIDICKTSSEYVFSLATYSSELSADCKNNPEAITLFAIDDSSSKVLTNFAKFIKDDGNAKNSIPEYRAGKVLNPKSIIHFVENSGNDYFGGLIILEKGLNTNNRIQVIRSNKADWLK